MSETNEAGAVNKEYATQDQIAFFERLRNGDDPVHEAARTEVVAMANEVLDLLAYPIDAGAMEYVAKTLADDSKLKLWPGERHGVPGREGKTYEEVFGNLLTDTDVRMHMVGDTGVMQFYHVLGVMARLMTLTGRGDRVVREEK
jgi:hypothetical protein